MSLTIQNGNLMVYYCFDIANEIKLDKVEKVFGKKPETSELVVERLTPEYIRHRVPPLLVRMGKVKIGKTEFIVKAKIYDFGVVTIIFVSKLRGKLNDLKKLSQKIASSKVLPKEARKFLEKIKQEIEPSMERHKIQVEEFFEDFLIFKVNKFYQKTKIPDLLKDHGKNIAKALRCDAGNLSENEIQDAIKNPLSYYEDDLVVVDWNAAFIYDKKESYDLIDVLEYALIESLELRTYDTVLDIVLEKAYTDISNIKKFSLYPHSKTISYLTEVKVEISDIIEKVSNLIKLIGDVYLAKVYASASERFYMNEWRKSVEKKLDTIESIYSTISGRTWDRRLLLVEVFMTALFVVWFALEMTLLLLGK